jgi:cell division protease FtsH
MSYFSFFLKNNKKNFQMKFYFKKIFVWVFITIMLLFGTWTIFNSRKSSHEEFWKVKDIINSSQNGMIIEGILENDRSGGIDWYNIKGKAVNKVYQKRNKLSNLYSFKNDIINENPNKNFFDLNNEKNKNFVTNFKSEGRLTENNFEILQKSGIFQEKRSGSLLSDFIFNIFPFIFLVIIIYFFLVKQIKVAGKNAMSFGKSKIKKLDKGGTNIKFSDVAGCDEAKEDVKDIVDFLKNPLKYKKIGGRIPNGALMVGPSGTGKTLMAKAIAGEANVPFFSISGSDFVEMFVGVGSARVRDTFQQSRKKAPCIIFIDEIDAVGKKRGIGISGGNDEREQTLNSLLVEMDGFNAKQGVVVIGATNRPDVLDNALLRPGRFDRKIYIDLPDIIGREKILNVHKKRIVISKNINIKMVAKNTIGFSGADLENLLNESALIAAKKNLKRVGIEEIEEARERISYGRERRKIIDKKDRLIVAYHEAGHAVVQSVIDDGLLSIYKVTIIPREKSLGSTMLFPEKDILNYSKKELENQICCAVGGRVAEKLKFKEITSGAASDIKFVTNLARKMVCNWGMSNLGFLFFGKELEHNNLSYYDKEFFGNNYSESTSKKIDEIIFEIIKGQFVRAQKIILKNLGALDEIAKNLLKNETINGKEIQEIINRFN